MLRNICRIALGTVLALALLSVSPASSQTATADVLNVVTLSDTATPTSNTMDRSGGLVRFVRGVTLRAAPGHRHGSVQLGLWHAQGAGNGFKIEFTPHHGIPSNGNVPGMDREDSRCTKTLAERNKNAGKVTAAATAIVILRRQNEASFRKYYRWQVKHHKVGKALQQKVQSVNSACKHHSPFQASVSANAVYYGQMGAGVTTVLAAHGLTAPSGLAVRTLGTNSNIFDDASHTNGRGIARFGYRLSADSGSVQATVSGPDATRANLLVTPDGKIRLLVNSYKATATATSKLQAKVLPKPTVRVTCGYACNGTGSVRTTATVPSSVSQPVRFTARNAATNHRWYVRPGTTHGTKFNAADASQVTLSYCYVKHVGDACASATHTYAGTPEVVAPAWIHVDSSDSCCTTNGTTVNLTLTVPSSSSRFYRAWVVENGNIVQTLDLSSTAGSAPKAITLKKGQVQVKFTAYRNSDRTGALSTQYVYDRTFN